ncbi:MAG: histidine phosphatase family protein [Verrucomicrobia bacterium]|nr:histidine phosphatase family protein [Verrucomicrobiota bacterium]
MPRTVYFITHPNVQISAEVPVVRWPLSTRGRERMQAGLRQPWLQGVTAIYCSTETKAMEGAGILGGHLGIDPRSDFRLGENDRTSTGYLPPAEFESTADEFFARPDISVRGWERAVDAQSRVVLAVRELVAADPTGGAIAIVAHGAVGALLRSQLAGHEISRQWDQPANGGGNYFWFTLSAERAVVHSAWLPFDNPTSDRRHYDLAHWPLIDAAEARRVFREIPLESYPGLRGYTRDQIHERLAGQGGLFLAHDMAELLSLAPGQRVLDLGCGAGTTSLFLARRYRVQVTAVDENIADDLGARAQATGVGHLVTPVKADCGQLPFPERHFDAIFALNSFFYFGADADYPTYLLRFLKPGGELVVGSPCYRQELEASTPEEFLLEYPACLQVHSPDWWADHFRKTGQVKAVSSALHPRGVEFWEDRVRYLLETAPHPEMPWWQDMTKAMIRMLNRDHDGFVSHFMLHLRTTAGSEGAG